MEVWFFGLMPYHEIIILVSDKGVKYLDYSKLLLDSHVSFMGSEWKPRNVPLAIQPGKGA